MYDTGVKKKKNSYSDDDDGGGDYLGVAQLPNLPIAEVW